MFYPNIIHSCASALLDYIWIKHLQLILYFYNNIYSTAGTNKSQQKVGTSEKAGTSSKNVAEIGPCISRKHLQRQILGNGGHRLWR